MTICKHFIQGKCNRNPCKYEHTPNVCFYFFIKGNCKFGKNCPKKHVEQQRSHKNTESFTPSHKPSDMRVVIDLVSFQSNDVFLIKDLFPDITYEMLLEEMNKDVFKLWHGDSHLIADDHQGWKQSCYNFNIVIERLTSYFKMDVKATRFNLYRDNTDWKPFHHDAAAIDPEKAKTQNMTIGVSFGQTRSACFEHAKTKTTVELPLSNGSVYGFGSKLNMEWRHGILQETEKNNNGRISIILWGWVDEKQV